MPKRSDERTEQTTDRRPSMVSFGANTIALAIGPIRARPERLRWGGSKRPPHSYCPNLLPEIMTYPKNITTGALLAVIIGVLSPLGIAHADDPQPTMPLAAKILFADAGDFDQWSGDEKYWSVDGDMIVGVNSAESPLPSHTYLIFQGGDDQAATFDNFELTAQFKIEGPGGNSGIQYRSEIKNAKRYKVGGYQADIDFGNRYAGILYEQDGRGIVAKRGQDVTINADGEKTIEQFADGQALGNGIHPGQWNDYRIVADGRTIEHFINETMTIRVVDHQENKGADSGVIALQLHKGPPMTVAFKNIVIREK